MREALKQELEAAEEGLEFPPMEKDPVTEDLAKRYNVADAKIAELRDEYMPLTIAGLEDRRGYEKVHAARMVVRDLRITVDKTRKALKEDALEYGRKVDREAKRIIGQLEPIEEHLEAEEKRIDAEKERIKQEKQRETEAKVQKRIDALTAVGASINLGEIVQMTDMAFDFALRAATEAFEAREAARKEAEAALARQQEAERKAAEEKAAAEQVEREAMAAERARMAAERAELDRKAAELKARQDAAEQAARDEQLRKDAERAAAERIKREQEEAAARVQAIEAAKPDAEKLLALAHTVEILPMPELTTEAGQKAAQDLKPLFVKLAGFIEAKAQALTK